MNKSRKIAVLLITSVLLTGLLITFLQRLTDGDRVSMLAHRIADFDLPAGYQTDYAIEMLDYTIASYKSADEQSHLVFVQGPSGVIPNESVIAGFIPNESRHADWHEATILLTEQRTIRDNIATLTISERTNGEGRRYRNANLVFTGREGTALLVMNQPVSEWNETTFEDFIASIH